MAVEKRDIYLHVKLRKSEKKRIKELADKEGITVSEYIRDKVLKGDD